VRNGVIALGLAIGVGLAAGVAPAQEPKPATDVAPANPCVDLAEPECGGIAGCVWLPGYEVASGAKVAGYCRPAPKPLTARRPPVAAPAGEQPR
jgi:hypothetical protein